MGPGSAAHHTGRCFASPGALRPGHERGVWRKLSHRHCERSEAIQSLSAEGFWIASSQELLAMTECVATLQFSGTHS